MTDARTTLGSLNDADAVARRIVRGGLSESAARDKASLFARAADALQGAGVDAGVAVRAFFVPGRIEVLGKHTDYAGGHSVVTATEKGFGLIVAPRDDSQIRALAADPDGLKLAEFAFSPDLTPTVGHWSNYPMTVARRIARNFPGVLAGADIAFAGDLPPAAGMSSSSALMVSFFLAFSASNALERREEYRQNIDDMESLAGYLGTVENGQSFGGLAGDKGVGTFGGSEDHTAILCCRSGKLSQYSYCPVRFERFIPLPDGYVLAVASCGVVAEKTGAAMEKYNRASRRASAVVQAWNEATGRSDAHIAAALADGDPQAAVERMHEILAERTEYDGLEHAEVQTRFEHFLAESEEIIPAAGDALAEGDLATFGRQVDRSQELTDTLLNNQIPETLSLARLARECGAVAASAFGAGFGGSVWALTRQELAEALLENWRKRYEEAHPAPAKNATFFTTQAGPAAFELT